MGSRLGSDYPPALHAYAGVLARFGGGQRRGRFWYTTCPAHEDNSPSLSFWLGEGGQLVFGCHANCRKADILRGAGLTMQQMFPGKEKSPRTAVAARYDYRDEAGALLYQVERLEWRDGDGRRHKRFRQRRPNPDAAAKERWLYNLDGARRVLYRLPELLRADPRRTVLVVSGEKDVETARSLGFVATTNVCGERSEWLPGYSEALSGRHVAVIPDGDAVGLRHAAEVAGALLIHEAASVCVCGLPEKDLTDFVEALRRRGVHAPAALRPEVERVLADAPRWRPGRRQLTA